MERIQTQREALRTRTSAIMDSIDAEGLRTIMDQEKLLWLLKQLEEKEIKLMAKDEQLEELIPIEQIREETDEAEEFRERILERKTKVEEWLRIARERRDQSQSSVGSRADEVMFKLPRVTIPKFNGEPTQWRSFWDQFRVAVHENTTISKVNKFVYLKSYMEGAALNTLSGFTLTEESYEDAVKKLRKKFGRKGVAINSHLSKISSLNPVKRSSDIAALRHLYDTCDVEVKCLEVLGVPKENYGYMFCHMVIKLLPPDIALDYSRKLESLDEYDVNILLDHLEKEVECRERAVILNRPTRDAQEEQTHNQTTKSRSYYKLETNNSRPSGFPYKSRVSSTAVLNVGIANPEECCYCNGATHKPEDCTAVTLPRKMELLGRQERCFLCLKPRHTARRCKSKKKCSQCQRRHHVSICREIHEETTRKSDAEVQPEGNTTTVSMTAVCSKRSSNEGTVLLQTIVVYAEDKGRRQPIRCLLDNGAQKSFISRDVVEQLNLPIVGQGTIAVGSFESEKSSTSVRRKVKVTLSSVNNPAYQIELTVLESPKIIGTAISIPGEDIRKMMSQRGVQLADVGEVQGQPVNKEISMLIAADYYWTIVTGLIHRLNDSFVALESKLGWAVQGTAPMSSNVFVVVMHAAIEVEEINKNLKAFWELEALGILEEKSMSRSDEEIIAKHNSTIQFGEGRYEVQLPWNERPDMLRSNFALSSRRMQGLVKKSQRSPALYQRYQDTFEEYLRQGIIEKVSPELIHSDGPKYYIPHFPVIREDKKTTKFRIVYDAAAHEKGQPSLNSLLSPGPNLNPDLLLILMRFRMGQIAVMADIEKAFLMISLASEDREFCRFPWIKSMPNEAEPAEPVEYVHCRMARVLFGVCSSPFLLAATLKYHFALYQDQYPEACSELTKSLYVDDLVCSVTSIEEAKTLYSQSTELLNKAGMNLRKWISNSKELSECWNNQAIIEEKSLSLTAEASPLSQRVLGISWDPHTDQLTFNVSPLLEFLETRKNTKRSVLQATARIFDPIGFLSPFLIRAKCLFQKLWIEGVDWDTELPLNLSQEWRQWCSELSNLRDIAIPRWYYEASGEEITSKEIHVFCHASKHAYGAVPEIPDEKWRSWSQPNNLKD